MQNCDITLPRRTKFDSVKLVHVKRDFNQAADYLTSKTLLLGRSWRVQEDDERQHLKQEKLRKSLEPHPFEDHSGLEVIQNEGNRLDIPGCPHVLGAMAAPLPYAAKILVAVTRASDRGRPASSEPLDPVEYQRVRWRGIKVNQEQHAYFLNGEVDRFAPRQLRKIAKVVGLFAMDARGVLYRLAQSTRGRLRDAHDERRLVVSTNLREAILHYTHEDVQGGHQGVKRTHEKLRSECYWPGRYADVERHVKECIDCASTHPTLAHLWKYRAKTTI
ncbi:reverse transcriptase [Phytophthora megakarya]|uniref:Reverse transcriptase n=1 Tax=Phytophthora megakarya TaxID=4795 RepID=A0A225WGB8_9STRA|nr:reverse transcriptase [Phytophthora megakarya]